MSDEVANTGVAGHIHSASAGGPRGSGRLSRVEIISPGNGIWLCAEHGRYVDTNEGNMYPPELLLSYKALHEAKTAREQLGIYSPMGWFQELILIESPVFASMTKMVFSKLNLIIGNNESGKTAICEWIAGVGDPLALSRWRTQRQENHLLKFKINYFNPEPKEAGLEINEDGEIKYFISKQEVPYHPYPIKFIFLRDLIIPTYLDRPDDLQLISDILNIGISTLKNLIPYFNRQVGGKVHNLRFKQVGEKHVLQADVNGTVKGLSLGDLSSTERLMVIIELTIAMAQFSAEYIPTILMLDGGMGSLDSSQLKYIGNMLLAPDKQFQTIIVLPYEPSNVSELSLLGWEIIHLKGETVGVKIDQNLF